MRSAIPIPFLGFYPVTFPQSELDEAVNLLGSNSASDVQRFAVGPPKKTEPLAPRKDYETKNPAVLEDFGLTKTRPIGDLVLARLGDKGANDCLKKLMGKDWKDWYFVERVEFPDIYAVHFVIYGPLGRGMSSSKLLDSLGKGFGEFIRAVHVPIPKKFLE
ncbi:hypothetical protein MPDQ_005805 [Monascus purpureus]|uniref:AtuA-like ferredoxin-fold domain-containing protein n=1 Tax=Monascus purpureus TaxID=5098 RepID=A0A507QZF4_MONPU|nr:hypothetical protein MPDQ_005805 [Monascus purpureus]